MPNKRPMKRPMTGPPIIGNKTPRVQATSEISIAILIPGKNDLIFIFHLLKNYPHCILLFRICKGVVGIVLRGNYPYNLLRSVISDRIVLKYYN